MKHGEPLQLTADEGMRMLKFLNMSQGRLEEFIDDAEYCGADIIALWKHMKILDAFIKDNEDEVAPRYEMVSAAYMESVAKLVEAARCSLFWQEKELMFNDKLQPDIHAKNLKCVYRELKDALADVEKGE
jgi:hypothetical protein